LWDNLYWVVLSYDGWKWFTWYCVVTASNVCLPTVVFFLYDRGGVDIGVILNLNVNWVLVLIGLFFLQSGWSECLIGSFESFSLLKV
jgi:hypothetical protein